MLTANVQARLDSLASARLRSTYPDLPDWVERLRPHQEDAIERVLDGFTRSDVVVLDAPTGAGKTLIAECVRRRLGVSTTAYICTTKTLQDQVGRDFPYAKVLKGRSNYRPTIQLPGLTCQDCNKRKEVHDEESVLVCSWCPNIHQCEYERAKHAALSSPLAVLNTSYFLTEANGPGRFSKRDLVVADECDVLENEVLRWMEVTISSARMKRYKWKTPKITVESDWSDWVADKQEQVGRLIARLPSDDNQLDRIRERRYLVNLESKLEVVAKGLADGGWIYTGDKQLASFKPVTVDSIGQGVLWSHSRKWLLMSATVVSASQLLMDLGWDGGYEDVRMGSTFPVANRPVRFVPRADMSRKANEREKLVEGLGDITSRHYNQRVLVHGVSYDLSHYLRDALLGLGREVYSYETASERDRSLDDFRASSAGVLVAPSMDRGVDLAQEDCRVQVICKVPHPYLGDKQVAARLYSSRNGQMWYAIQAIRTIVQMCGRAVRSEDDWAITYILDSQFEKLYLSNKQLFPDWWKEALIWKPAQSAEVVGT